jgi:hypothetical protein
MSLQRTLQQPQSTLISSTRLERIIVASGGGRPIFLIPTMPEVPSPRAAHMRRLLVLEFAAQKWLYFGRKRPSR